MFCMATLAAGSWQHQYSEQFFLDKPFGLFTGGTEVSAAF